MCSITTMVADQYRLLEWAEQIKSCQNRPDGMQVKEWCSQNGITKSNYYYRLRRVRQACLDTFPVQTPPSVMEPVPAELLNPISRPSAPNGIDISAGTFKIHVTESTSMELLGNVLKVMAHAE